MPLVWCLEQPVSYPMLHVWEEAMTVRNPHAYRAACIRNHALKGGTQFMKQAIDLSEPGAIRLQIGKKVVSPHDWPRDDKKLRGMKRDHRRSTHKHIAALLHVNGFPLDLSTGKNAGFEHALESIEFIRFGPVLLDDDGLVQAFHHYRDGVWDAAAGMKTNYHGDAVWKGSAADHPGCGVAHAYDQAKRGEYGYQIVLRGALNVSVTLPTEQGRSLGAC